MHDLALKSNRFASNVFVLAKQKILINSIIVTVWRNRGRVNTFGALDWRDGVVGTDVICVEDLLSVVFCQDPGGLATIDQNSPLVILIY